MNCEKMKYYKNREFNYQIIRVGTEFEHNGTTRYNYHHLDGTRWKLPSHPYGMAVGELRLRWVELTKAEQVKLHLKLM